MKTKYDFKQLYINGNIRLFGSQNLYKIWNNFMFKLFKKYTIKKIKTNETNIKPNAQNKEL